MRMLIVPNPGRMVRHPTTRQHLPADGLVDEDNAVYWKRREKEGAVTIEPAPPKTLEERLQTRPLRSVGADTKTPVTPAQEE